jgi:molecular chaperone GrpE
MSARGAKKGEDRAPHQAPRKPPTPPSAPEDDDGIEILEVVGVDETTGAAPERSAPLEHPAPRHPATETPSEALRQALADKDRYYDLLLRKQAEFENFRKRIEKEKAEARSALAADLARGLLPALDNLERALVTSEGSTDPLRQGVVLIHQQIREALAREGVRPMDALGARFNPHLHEAVQVLDVDGFEEGVILEEMQKGYLIDERLLRPALVKVASGRSPSGGRSEPAAKG